MNIGLTGPNAAGKGEAAKILEKSGFKYFSLSDQIRKECKKQNLEPTRDNMIKIGNLSREKHNEGIWATKLLECITDNAVIDSIRHPLEVHELTKLNKFTLISISAPIEIRFKRAVKRNRIGDPDTLEEFKAKEELEMTNNKNSQQINETVKLADFVVVNDGSLIELEYKLNRLIESLHNFHM